MWNVEFKMEVSGRRSATDDGIPLKLPSREMNLKEIAESLTSMKHSRILRLMYFGAHKYLSARQGAQANTGQLKI